jgi:Uma2 family endonuclease
MATALLDAPPTTVAPIRDDADSLYEIIDGERKETEPMGAYMTLLAFQLAVRMNEHASRHQLGIAVTEMLFRFQREPDRSRRPDVAFVSRERCQQSPVPPEGDWDVVPDLAVEVVIPGNNATELEQKLVEYFRFGVRQVWVLHPGQRRLYVHESLRKVSALNEDDTLTGGDVLPGFSLKLTDLFAAIAMVR